MIPLLLILKRISPQFSTDEVHASAWHASSFITCVFLHLISLLATTLTKRLAALPSFMPFTLHTSCSLPLESSASSGQTPPPPSECYLLQETALSATEIGGCLLCGPWSVA